MNKSEAIAHMISKVEEIERERLAAHFSIDATKQKKEAVDGILKALLWRRECTLSCSGRPCFLRISLNRHVKVDGVMGSWYPFLRNT